jgi:phosphate acetyltransferase
MQPNYFGTMLLNESFADCLLSGASYTTAETLRPALQIIKSKGQKRLASSFFMMVLDNKVYFFADCAFNRYPTADELAQIAIDTADSAKKFGITPKVAMLSYSTKGSGSGKSVDTVKQATQIVKERRKDILIDGEMQLDAAIVPRVATLKCVDSPVAGDANVLIFPDLNSGNIGYKLVERLAKAQALGPIVQGMEKHINVLSRGCNVEDIVSVAAITIMQSLSDKGGKNYFKSESHLLSKKK